MQQLLESAISEGQSWEASPTREGVSGARVENVRDKLIALRGCRNVGLLRTGLEQVIAFVTALDVPISDFAPSIHKLSPLLAARA